MSARGQRIVDRCREIAAHTDEPGRITRTFLSPALREAQHLVAGWMTELGMRVTLDSAGNLRGVANPGSGRRLLIGSHLDTVPDGGAFDGALGIVLGIALVEELGSSCSLEIEVLGFSDEEGVRFGLPFIGSRALTGTLDPAAVELISSAVSGYGLDASRLNQDRFSPASVAYLEFHIEQGPVLESLNLPVGVVDAIAGQSRGAVTFIGRASHAGTTPMAMRKDALAAAAGWIAEVERYARQRDGLVATVGSVRVEPNAANVIPGRVELSLDVRHAADPQRLAAVRDLIETAAGLGARRGIEVSYLARIDQPAVTLDAGLRVMLEESIEAAGYPVHHLASGAGHDAQIVAPHLPSAMVFLRSRGGISHHPAETVEPKDVEAALDSGLHFIRRLEKMAGQRKRGDSPFSEGRPLSDQFDLASFPEAPNLRQQE